MAVAEHLPAVPGNCPTFRPSDTSATVPGVQCYRRPYRRPILKWRGERKTLFN